MDGTETALVLWGEGCDESLAVAWVSRLRREGRRVYLVGVSGRRMRGKYGVELVVDMGLDEALGVVQQVDLVIVPCEEDAVHTFSRDPRSIEFLVLAEQAGAEIVEHTAT